MINLLEKRLHFTVAAELNIGDQAQDLFSIQHINTTIEENDRFGEHLDTHFRVKYAVVSADFSEGNVLTGSKGDFCLVCKFKLDENWDSDQLDEMARDTIPKYMWTHIIAHVTYQIEMYGLDPSQLKISEGGFDSQHKKAKRRRRIKFEGEVLR